MSEPESCFGQLHLIERHLNHKGSHKKDHWSRNIFHLADLSAKMIFVDSFRDVAMTEDLAREIKNEVQVFQHSTDIATFRLTFDYYCDDLFTKYGVYDTNTDLEERDRSCLYLAYTYVMIQVSAKSVMTSMTSFEEYTVGFWCQSQSG